MLDPGQMTPDTLMSNINALRAQFRTQPNDFTREDHARLDTLTKERERRIVAARGNLRPGLYVSSAWKDEPHKGILWSLDENGNWHLRVSDEASDEFKGKRANPELFFGVGWERHVVQLFAKDDSERVT